MTVSLDDTIVLHGGGDKKLIEERCEEVCAWLIMEIVLFFVFKLNFKSLLIYLF